MRLFVTGTDTGVGKTEVTAALARAARASGERVVAAKPVASGVTGEPSDDAARLALAGGHAPQVRFAFRAPVSPHQAARLEDRQIDPTQLIQACRDYEADVVLVEGVGGFRVPLAQAFDVADWAVALGWPVLVVAADRLGVLNHTRLTVEACGAAGLRVVAVVLNRGVGDEADPSRATNAADLSEWTKTPVVPFPRLTPVAPGVSAVEIDLWRRIREVC